MARRQRNAFTLVEILIVIVIIGLLVGISVPAVLMARAAARRTQCANNQGEILKAIAAYENTKDSLPGYANNVASNTAGWPVVILSEVDQNDVWEQWRDGNTPTKLIPTYICPVANRALPGRLSYVVNCGEWDTNVLDSGPFRDRSGAAKVISRTDKIADGARNTIALSESLQAVNWDPSNAATTNDYIAQQGLIWTADATTFTNRLCDGSGDPVVFPNNCPDGPAGNLMLARPSSNHAGSVVTGYFDGSVKAMSTDNLDETVYLQLVNPEG